jgi:hypothetical protein
LSVRVVTDTGAAITLDNGDSWEMGEGNLNVMHHGKDVEPDKVIASFAPGQWEFVAQVAKDDKSAMLAEARALISEVDDGSFGHQSTDWQNRAEDFLNNTSGNRV